MNRRVCENCVNRYLDENGFEENDICLWWHIMSDHWNKNEFKCIHLPVGEDSIIIPPEICPYVLEHIVHAQ
jgi:hypothetical protein